MSAIRATDVRVSLGGAPILHGVDLDVAAGEWVTIIGPNGAGKSTLLRVIGGVLQSQGEIRVHGTPVRHMGRRELARLVATVPQNPVVPPGMGVLDYVLLGRTPYIRPLGRESMSDLEVAHHVLERLDLTAFAQRPLTTLSGGERQRVFLARALAQITRRTGSPTTTHGGVLLLDEPTSSLDIGHQQEVLDLVDELRTADRELTVLATMHDLSVAGSYADRLVLLARGRVVACGTPAQVLTEETLSRHYGARVRVIDTGTGPLVVPVREHQPS